MGFSGEETLINGYGAVPRWNGARRDDGVETLVTHEVNQPKREYTQAKPHKHYTSTYQAIEPVSQPSYRMAGSAMVLAL